MAFGNDRSRFVDNDFSGKRYTYSDTFNFNNGEFVLYVQA